MSGDRLYPARPFLAASVAVIRDGEILVASRGKHAAGRVLFSLPGGRSRSARRWNRRPCGNFAEEVGVNATLTGLIAPFEFIEREADGHIKHHVVIAVFAARWVVRRTSDRAGSKGNPLDHGAGDRRPADDAGAWPEFSSGPSRTTEGLA